MEELKLAVAYIFKRKGGGEIPESDFLYSASMDLRWFTPKEAQQLLENAVEQGLLAVGEDSLTTTFDPLAIDIPLDFKPSDKVLEAKPDEGAGGQRVEVLGRLVDFISEKTGMEKQKVMSLVNKKQERMMVDVDVAALMVANEHGLDIAGYLEDVERVVRSRF